MLSLMCDARGWDQGHWRLTVGHFKKGNVTLVLQKQTMNDMPLLVTSVIEPHTWPGPVSWWARDIEQLSAHIKAAHCKDHDDGLNFAPNFADAYTDRVLALAVLASVSDEASCEWSAPGHDGESYSFLYRCSLHRPKILVRHGLGDDAQNFFVTVAQPGSERCSGSAPRRCSHGVTWRALLVPWATMMIWRSPRFDRLVAAMEGLLLQESPSVVAARRERMAETKMVLEMLSLRNGDFASTLPTAGVFDCPVQSETCTALQLRAQRLWEQGWLDNSLESAAATTMLFEAARSVEEREVMSAGAGQRAASPPCLRSFQTSPHAPAALAELGGAARGQGRKQ